MTKKQAEKAKLIEDVTRLKNAGYKQKEIAEMLNVTVDRVKKITSNLRDEVVDAKSGVVKKIKKKSNEEYLFNMIRYELSKKEEDISVNRFLNFLDALKEEFLEAGDEINIKTVSKNTIEKWKQKNEYILADVFDEKSEFIFDVYDAQTSKVFRKKIINENLEVLSCSDFFGTDKWKKNINKVINALEFLLELDHDKKIKDFKEIKDSKIMFAVLGANRKIYNVTLKKDATLEEENFYKAFKFYYCRVAKILLSYSTSNKNILKLLTYKNSNELIGLLKTLPDFLYYNTKSELNNEQVEFLRNLYNNNKIIIDPSIICI